MSYQNLISRTTISTKRKRAPGGEPALAEPFAQQTGVSDKALEEIMGKV